MSRYDDNFKTVTIDGKPTRILKDGGRVRISMHMRDAMRTVHGDLESTDAKPLITDGRTTDPLALNKPGFRVPVVNDRRAVHDAYANYNTCLTNRYKVNDGDVLCEDCGGEGYDKDGNVCSSCNGDGVIDDDDIEDNDTDLCGDRDPISDSHKHRQTMDQLYRERDMELTNAWRKP